MSEQRPIAIVTGSSRGAGRGIAVALGGHGCTVYVTGRSERRGDHLVAGTIYETAEAVTAAGGHGIPIRVDHGDDVQVKALFDRVEEEQGRLDILVNNAFATHDAIVQPGPFWEKPLELVAQLDVGLRSGYVASYYAAPLMIRGGQKLIAFTSGPGAVRYAYGPAYGAQKAGVDKLAADMAVDFADRGVAVVSIWLGLVLTERVNALISADPVKFSALAESAETPELTGHVLWGLFNDSDLMKQSGETLIGAEVAATYGILDAGGKRPPSRRDALGVEPGRRSRSVLRSVSAPAVAN